VNGLAFKLKFNNPNKLTVIQETRDGLGTLAAEYYVMDKDMALSRDQVNLCFEKARF
jgi:hypothetical protein